MPCEWTGTDWPAWCTALAKALARITQFATDALVISLGVDTFIGDPISAFTLISEDYLKLGHTIARVGLPTLFVMEGGYAVGAIGSNVVNVLSGFEAGTARGPA